MELVDEFKPFFDAPHPLGQVIVLDLLAVHVFLSVKVVAARLKHGLFHAEQPGIDFYQLRLHPAHAGSYGSKMLKN